MTAVTEHKISLFIPIFNESRIVNRSLKAIDYILRGLGLPYEIFIVNDASRDNTGDVVKSIQKDNARVTLLDFDYGPTRRENLAQSFKKAGGDIIAFADVDSISSLRSLGELVGQVASGYDIVTGSRFARGSQIKRKPSRLIMSILYNALIRSVFKTNIRDHMCGFKAFKREVILELVEEMGFDSSLTRGIFWDTELLIRALAGGYTVKEMPIRWIERSESKLYFKREIRAIGYIIRFLMNYKRGK